MKDNQGWKIRKNLFAVMLALVMLLCAGTGAVAEDESAAILTVSAAAPEMETEGSADSDAAAAEGYILRAFGLGGASGTKLRIRSVSLDGNNALLYSRLVTIVQEVAAGQRTDTLCEIPLTEFGIKTSYTPEELGLETFFVQDEVTGDYSISGEAGDRFIAAVNAELGLDLALIGNKLRAELPYDMYWASNVRITSGGIPGFSASSDGINEAIYFPEGSMFSYPIYVAPEYSATGADETTKCKADFGEAVTNAVANAQAIVEEYAGVSDYEKLMGYKNAICELVDYNHAAADDNSTPYGNPWQPVWVFDGDPDTKVVCEGYSKAFKYLCDMTTFSGDVSVALVSGTMSGGTGAGAHMWNLVSVGGVNYLVDVTNCDEGSVGNPDELFMAGYSDLYNGSDGTSGYIYTANGNPIVYVYDENMKKLFSAKELKPSDEALEGETLRLPADLKTIGVRAFEHTAAEVVIIPESCEEVGDYAFANSQNLRIVKIPAALEGSYNKDLVFDGCSDQLEIRNY